jgi:hypothetical protein
VKIPQRASSSSNEPRPPIPNAQIDPSRSFAAAVNDDFVVVRYYERRNVIHPVCDAHTSSSLDSVYPTPFFSLSLFVFEEAFFGEPKLYGRSVGEEFVPPPPSSSAVG